MTTLNEVISDSLKDPEFAEEWDRLEPEYAILSVIVDAREQSGLTQAELARRCGMTQSALSRLETGKSSPTIKTLQQLARGLGKKLEVKFV